MAVGIYFAGKRLIRPQSFTQINDEGMYARGLGGANNLAIIGECTGGEPNHVYWFSDPSYAKSILKSGPLLQAVQRAYDPSAETSGAYLIAAIRVNPALMSQLTLTDAVQSPLIFLKSVDYGLWNNQIKARVETGTNSGTKKITITYGTSYDQGNNLERKSIYLACTDTKARSATCTISKSTDKLTTTVISNVQSIKTYVDSTGLYDDVYDEAEEDDSSYFIIPELAVDFLYAGSDQMFGTITYKPGDVVQDVAAVMSGQYWNGTAWTALSAFTDGTSGGVGKPFSTLGNITYTIPTNWTKTIVDSSSQYWVRLKTSTSLTSGANGNYIWLGRGLDVTLSGYATVQQLTDYLDAQPHYEAYPATLAPNTELPTDLDDLSAGNVMTGNTYLVAAYTSGTTLSVFSAAGYAIGDYVVVSSIPVAPNWISSEEMRKVTNVSTSANTIVIDSALSSTYIGTGDVVTRAKVRKALILKSDLQAVIDWVNAGNTGFVTAQYGPSTWEASKYYTVGDLCVPTSSNGYWYRVSQTGTSATSESTWPIVVGTTVTNGTVVFDCGGLLGRSALKNVVDTYFTGGSEGTTLQTHWDTAIELLQNEDTPLITCVSYDPAVWASLSSHCSYMSGIGKMERIGFCGGFAAADGYTAGLGKWASTTVALNSIDQMLTYAESLNSDRMVYVGPGFKAYDDNGLMITYPGSISAALVAGMAAGVDVAEALTHDSIKVIGLEYNFRWADLDRLLLGGVLPLEYDPGFGYRVCQSITTWLRSDKYNRREVSVRRTADYVAKQVRERLDRDFVGRKGTITTLISIKNATASVLQQCYRLELLAGDATNPAYKNIQCRLEGDTCYVEFECSPVIPINYVAISVNLTVYSATVVA